MKKILVRFGVAMMILLPVIYGDYVGFPWSLGLSFLGGVGVGHIVIDWMGL